LLSEETFTPKRPIWIVSTAASDPRGLAFDSRPGGRLS